MPSPTAILLFSRTAASELAAKPFGAGGRRIVEALLERTRRTLRRSGLPVFRSSEAGQSGHDFGHRLAHAVTDVFERGYRQVIVVGNDCPTLSVRTLRAAERALLGGRSVVGRDGRGGAYLIGLRAVEFSATRLAGLAWCSSRLFTELDDLLGPDTAYLRPRLDINNLRDLRVRWWQLRRLLAVLADLFGRRERGSGPAERAIRATRPGRPPHRGPPVAA